MVEETIGKLESVLKDETVLIAFDSIPTFLSPFVNNVDEKVIFIYRRAEEHNNTTVVLPKKSDDVTDVTEGLDLTGNPLECPFSINGDTSQSTILIPTKPKELDKYCPLTIHEARKILSTYNLSTSTTVSVYVLTDGLDFSHTIVLSSEKNNGWYARSWITFNKYDNTHSQEANLQTMIQQHHALAQISPKRMQSEVSCLYLIENAVDNPSTILTEYPGHIELHVNWKTPSVNIPLHEASTNIVIHSVVGHESSEVLYLWKQILLLNDLLQLTKKWKEEILLQQPYSRHNIVFPNILQFMDEEIVKSRKVTERLSRLLTEPIKCVADIGLMRKNESCSSNQISQTISSLVDERKSEQEFTDQLWNILIECTSYQEVSSSFESVFKHVRNGICRPYIKSTNMSRLSDALRCCKRDPSSNMGLMLEPIEMLIEIGIEKLKKDYISTFLITKIATMEQLCVPALPKFIDVNVSDWNSACSSWILWFVHMHVTLEMALLTENLLKLDSSVMLVTGGILKHYLGEKSALTNLDDIRSLPVQQFEMVVNTRNIQKHLWNGRPFNSWSLKLTSEEAHKKVQSLFYRTSNEIFPSCFYNEDKFDLINCTYVPNANCTNICVTDYCYTRHSVSNKLL